MPALLVPWNDSAVSVILQRLTLSIYALQEAGTARPWKNQYQFGKVMPALPIPVNIKNADACYLNTAAGHQLGAYRSR